MIIYVLLEALAGIVGGILIAKSVKKTDAITYGSLDKAGIVTNVVLSVVYVCLSPVYMFIGVISEPDGEGIVMALGLIVSLITASAAMFCAVGIGLSVALRRKGMSKESFAVQFAGMAGIALSILLYCVFAGSLLVSLN